MECLFGIPALWVKEPGCSVEVAVTRRCYFKWAHLMHGRAGEPSREPCEISGGGSLLLCVWLRVQMLWELWEQDLPLSGQQAPTFWRCRRRIQTNLHEWSCARAKLLLSLHLRNHRLHSATNSENACESGPLVHQAWKDDVAGAEVDHVRQCVRHTQHEARMDAHNALGCTVVVLAEFYRSRRLARIPGVLRVCGSHSWGGHQRRDVGHGVHCTQCEMAACRAPRYQSGGKTDTAVHS